MLEKNAQNPAGLPAKRRLPGWPVGLLLALVPVAAVVAAVVVLGPMAKRRTAPPSTPASPSLPRSKPSESIKGDRSVVAPDKVTGAQRGQAGSTPAPASQSSGSDPGNDPPPPPAPRPSQPSQGWGHGSNAAPPTPANQPDPSPPATEGVKDQSARPTSAAALATIRMTNPFLQPWDRWTSADASADGHESAGWIELEDVGTGRFSPASLGDAPRLAGVAPAAPATP